MKTHKNIKNKVDTTLQSIEAIEEVKVSPFLKDKIIQRLYLKKNQEVTTWSWFTPQLQLATLVCVVGLNIFAFTQLDLSTDTSNLEQFAQGYDLIETDDSYIFN